MSLVWEQGRSAPVALGLILLLTSMLTLVEALVLRGIVDIGRELTLDRQRAVAIAALIVFLGLLSWVDTSALAALQALGRRLESALRIAFLTKLPRLGLRYFRSRPSADMAERVHMVHAVRAMPALTAEVLRSVAGLAATTAGIIIVDPRGFVPALLVSLASVGIPLATRVLLTERELRFRTHAGAMYNFYLDAQIGLVPLRTHGAEHALRSEHERVLVEWRSAGKRLLRVATATDGVGAAVSVAFVAWLLVDYVERGADAKGILLVAYWGLALGTLGQRLTATIRQYPPIANVTLRLLEPLGAPDELPAANRPHRHVSAQPEIATAKAPSLKFERATVRAGGHTILDNVTLQIGGGAHVAVVGSSGAGKSSLLALLLGLHRASSGSVFVDDAPLDGPELEQLRRHTAWVDPSVRLWNATLLANIRYGSPSASPIGAVVDASDLRTILSQLPEGMQSHLGEGGALVSGGEGQRVRLARALGRAGARLALLDEPFRGLDIDQRRLLLTRAREWWRHATLLCVTHDVRETLVFPRVLVVEGGRVVEDGEPNKLAAQGGSRFAALLKSEGWLREGLWEEGGWKRLHMDRGALDSRGEATR
jgi:ATP-binding cassette subfamily B protein